MEMKNVFYQKFYTEEVTENVGSIQILGGEIEKTDDLYTVTFEKTKFVKCDFTRLGHISDSENPKIKLMYPEIRLIFINCIFNDCNFNTSTYVEPAFDNCEFTNCFLNDITFINADFIKCNFIRSEVIATFEDCAIQDGFNFAYCGNNVYLSFIKDTWVTCDIGCVMSKCGIRAESSKFKGIHASYSSISLNIETSSIDNHFDINKSEVHISSMKSMLININVDINMHFSELYLAEKEMDITSTIQFYRALKLYYTDIKKI